MNYEAVFANVLKNTFLFEHLTDKEQLQHLFGPVLV